MTHIELVVRIILTPIIRVLMYGIVLPSIYKNNSEPQFVSISGCHGI